MRLLTPVFLILLYSLPPLWAANSEALPAWSTEYSSLRDPFSDAKEAITRAQNSGRRILIEVGGDWCVWCHVLQKVIDDNPDIHQVLNDHFVLLKVSVDEKNDNAQFLKGLPRSDGFPKLYVSRANGSIIHVQDTTEFMLNGNYDAARVMQFLQRWKTMAN